uniref:Uncharacterized protein n=1 Tax=Tetranychus urticae TaxID=32264 RepID=T1JV55_TETUR
MNNSESTVRKKGEIKWEKDFVVIKCSTYQLWL